MSSSEKLSGLNPEKQMGKIHVISDLGMLNSFLFKLY